MQRVIKPEILLLLGFVSVKLLPSIISNDTMAGIVGFASLLILLLGAAGIAQRNRVSLIIFLLGFGILFLAFLFDRVFNSTYYRWETIGTAGSLLIFAAIISSWAVSLMNKSGKQGRP